MTLSTEAFAVLVGIAIAIFIITMATYRAPNSKHFDNRRKNG